MITLDYSLDAAATAAGGVAVDLATADEMKLRYDCFLGDVVFVVGAEDLSARWGWVPVLDFAVALDSIADSLVTDSVFEFTESDATITFRRDGDLVHIAGDYVPGTAAVPLEELRTATDTFLRKVVTDLTRLHPELARNPYVVRLGVSS